MAGTVLFIHGHPLRGAMWEGQALPAGFRALAPDLAGHGDAPARGRPVSMEELARDLLLLLDREGVKRGAVCGLSMGGYVALAMYRIAPYRFAGLMLADTRAGADGEAARANREKAAQKALAEGTAAVVEDLLPRLIAPGAGAEVRARAKALMLATPPQGLADAQRGMARRADQTDLLARIACPTAVVVGAEDVLIPPPESRALAAAIPGAELVEIAGAGHLSNLEKPAEFNAALARWLSRVSGE